MGKAVEEKSRAGLLWCSFSPKALSHVSHVCLLAVAVWSVIYFPGKSQTSPPQAKIQVVQQPSLVELNHKNREPVESDNKVRKKHPIVTQELTDFKTKAPTRVTPDPPKYHFNICFSPFPFDRFVQKTFLH